MVRLLRKHKLDTIDLITIGRRKTYGALGINKRAANIIIVLKKLVLNSRKKWR